MILASHQPNFMPYMGFFYKMYMCDTFTLSDTVLFSNSGFHNYNFIDCRGRKHKLTIPVSNRSGAIQNVMLADWEHYRRKIWRTLEENYSKAPHFKELAPIFKELLMADYKTLQELNEAIIMAVHKLFGFDCQVIRESDLGVTGYSPSEQIADICKKTYNSTYLSGTGAKAYLQEECLNSQGIRVVWSPYKTVGGDLSVFHYLMHEGANIPEEWKAQKRGLRNGRV